jgi:hypothetical protein
VAAALNVADRVDFLRAELNKQQERFARRRQRDKRKAFTLQMATVTLSASITVLLGLRLTAGIQQTLANVALALGALVTVLAAMEAFFNHRGLWISRTVTVRRLEELRRHVDYKLAGLSDGEISPQLVDELLAELDHIVADDNKSWLRLRSAEVQSKTSADEVV